MKTILAIVALFITVVLNAQNVTKVLFIGNSITYFNDMPSTFESIANSLGDSTQVTVYAPGGTGFVNHATDVNVYNHIKQGDWDYIVLQPGSNESPGYSFPIDETLGRAKMLNDSISEYNPCAKVLYYEISYGVWGNSANDLVTYNNTMDLIKNNVQYLADSTSAFLAPVGEGFRTSWNTNLNNMLWGGVGDIHPNNKGSYIAACTFYASIFQKPSLGSPIINGLSVSEASSYQHLADSVVLNHLSEWRINTYDLYTDFTFNQTSDSIYFNNLSLNADSVLWNFDNGDFSTDFNPVYSYTANGNYTVNLTSYKGECSETISKDIEVNGLNIKNLVEDIEYIIYPNPVQNTLYIHTEIQSEVEYRILDSTGKILYVSTELEFNVQDLKSGLYYLQIFNLNKEKIEVVKWIKQ